MKREIEQFLRGYRLAYSNLKWGAELPQEKRTYETYAERMEWQKTQKTGLDCFSRVGGWTCVILHFPTAVRMHMATNHMLKDKVDKDFQKG